MGRRPSSGRGNGETDSSSPCSFLKFLNDDDFDSRLKIPSQFVKKHGRVFRQGFCYLTAGGDFPSQRKWRVCVERLGQDHFLGDGWEKFAKNIGLNLGDYAVFNCADRSEMEVSVYDTSGCRKDNNGIKSRDIPATPPKIKKEDDDGEEVKEEEEEEEKVFPCGTAPRAPKSWIFSKTMFTDDMESLEIPASFMRDTAMEAYRSAVLRVAGGGVWHVTIKKSGVVFHVRSGWSSFVRDNGVEIGDTVWFKFIPRSGNEIDISFTRKKF